jgi:hypothetical protein
VVGHNGHTFDMATAYELVFNNLKVNTAPGSVPKTLFFCARNSVGSGAGMHRFNNIGVADGATFSFIFYGYGSEENFFYANEWFNAQPGSALVSHNATNPSAFTSTFVPIAKGEQSNSVNRHSCCDYFQLGNSDSHNEVVFSLENTDDFSFRDGLWGCSHGDAYVIVSGSQPSNRLTFDSIRGEPLGTQPAHGVDVTANSGTHTAWTFNNVNGDCSGFFLPFSSGASIKNLAIRATVATSGSLVLAYNMSNSIIETMVDSIVQGQTGGSVSNNVFIGGRNNVTAGGGTFSSNIYADNFSGEFGVDGDLVAPTVTPCTGALTANSQWQLRLSPNGKTIFLELSSTIGVASAAASFSFGTVIPAAYRPATTLVFGGILIQDNGTLSNQPGKVTVTSFGVITVNKDMVGSAAFTAGTAAGIPSNVIVNWNL